ncbi:MAG TPA: hypothetical protein VMT47_11455 [Polyangia bacterium]|nr:hypothetical protein [Polyangia bacterium]
MRAGVSVAVRAIALLLLAAAPFACGSPAAPADGNAPGSSDGAVEGAAADTGGDVASEKPFRYRGCPDDPSHLPMNCEQNLECDYAGSGASGRCTTIELCDLNIPVNDWVTIPPADTCGTHPPPCPGAFDALPEGAACPVPKGLLQCDYDEARCGCLGCSSADGTPGAVWSCRKWGSGGEGCPNAPVLGGTACETPGQLCAYGTFCGVSAGGSFQCAHGYWQRAPSAPVTCAPRACPR